MTSPPTPPTSPPPPQPHLLYSGPRSTRADHAATRSATPAALLPHLCRPRAGTRRSAPSPQPGVERWGRWHMELQLRHQAHQGTRWTTVWCARGFFFHSHASCIPGYRSRR